MPTLFYNPEYDSLVIFWEYLTVKYVTKCPCGLKTCNEEYLREYETGDAWVSDYMGLFKMDADIFNKYVEIGEL
jgi:hypothetical protein